MANRSGEIPDWILGVLVLMWLPVLLIFAISFFITSCINTDTVLGLLGWKFKGPWENLKPGVIIMAPHTSYWDAIIGKLGLLSKDIDHVILSAPHLFWFPMNLFMRYILGAIPVGGKPGSNSITEASNYLKSNPESSIIICPEGQLDPTDKWNPGFYYMAYKANVPVLVVSLDYKNKEIVYHGSLNPQELSKKDIMMKLREFYKNSNPKHPSKFILSKPYI